MTMSHALSVWNLHQGSLGVDYSSHMPRLLQVCLSPASSHVFMSLTGPTMNGRVIIDINHGKDE